MKENSNDTNRPASAISRRDWLAQAAAAGSVLTGLGAGSLPVSASPAKDLQLSMCVSDNIRTLPLRDGRVKPDAIELNVSTAFPSEMFWRQLSFSEFDISEMSWSSLLIAISQGDTRWVALPVFTARGFPHTGILVRTDKGIDKPSDLKGKRVAVPEYQQTSALWSRGVLQHDFGVTAFDVDWYMERTEELSHGAATGFKPPEGLKFQRIVPPENIGTMLLDGKVDASLLYLTDVNLVDRSRINLSNRPEIRLLFPDAVAEGARYYKKTGFYPANHCVVIQRKVLEENPWVALNIYKAFGLAKDLVQLPARDFASIYFDLDLMPGGQRKVLDIDPYPYGVQANKAMLEALTQFSFEQGLTKRKLSLAEVFYAPTLDL